MTLPAEHDLVIHAPARLLTVNAERTLHYRTRARIVKEWRWAAKVEAKTQKLPRFAWCDIAVSIVQQRGPLADPGAHYPVVKAVVDGLVDAGVLLGDTGQYVRLITQSAPIKGPWNLVGLMLTGERR
ncbi:MAG TPA: hypothetical protein VHB02_06145 [Acidimicrobiales bacterium]|nr:hypothetical protein [Acidimicrobiales bacterium]